MYPPFNVPGRSFVTLLIETQEEGESKIFQVYKVAVSFFSFYNKILRCKHNSNEQVVNTMSYYISYVF